MPVYVSQTGGSFEPAPEGLFSAICCDVVEKGLVATQWGPKEKVQIRWLLGEDAGAKEDGSQWMVMKQYNMSLNEKATLYKDLVRWRGRAFTPDELKRFDLETVLNVPCMIFVVHNKSTTDDSIFANADTIMPLAKGMKAPTIRDYVRAKDRATDGVDVAAVRQSLQAGQVRQVDTETGEITEVAPTTPKPVAPSEACQPHDEGNAEFAAEVFPEEKRTWDFKHMDEITFKAFCKVHGLSTPKEVCARLGISSWAVIVDTIGFGNAASKIADMAANQ